MTHLELFTSCRYLEIADIVIKVSENSPDTLYCKTKALE